MKPRDIPLTREDVSGWLAEYDGRLEPTKKMRDFLTSKLQGRELQDIQVDTVEHQDLEDLTPLIEMILMDLPSYA